MPEMITTNDAQYAFDIVQTICQEVGPGVPGSAQERERAAILQKELESHLGAEHVVVETFTLAPRAFLSAYPISAILMLIAALLNISIGRFTGVSPWLAASAALGFSILAPLAFLFQFVLNFELVDRLFQKKQSVNVIGTLRKPGTNQVKRLLILSGHHDSAPENTWLRLLGDLKRLLIRSDHPDRNLEDSLLRFLSLMLLPWPLSGLVQAVLVLAMRRDPTMFTSMAGTVGISAIGMFGKGHSGWGMYPPTRSLELLVGSTAWKPAVVEGRIAPRQILNLTVLFDHAVIDGAPAARFTRRLVELIESGYGLGEDLTMIATHTEPAAVWAAQVVA